MSDSTTNKVTMACTVVTTCIVIWQQATGVPASWVTYLATFVAGFGFGYSARYFLGRAKARERDAELAELRGKLAALEAARETPHNRLCRETLAKLSDMKPGEGAEWLGRELYKESIDGGVDLANAVCSLVEQGCLRGVGVVSLGRPAPTIAFGDDFSVTGKRYADD